MKGRCHTINIQISSIQLKRGSEENAPSLRETIDGPQLIDRVSQDETSYENEYLPRPVAFVKMHTYIPLCLINLNKCGSLCV
jgi:hypothetical protein